jgi:histone H3/H4
MSDIDLIPESSPDSPTSPTPAKGSSKRKPAKSAAAPAAAAASGGLSARKRAALERSKGQKQPRSGVVKDAATIQKKKHRWRSGTVALREIKKYQTSTELLLRKLPFQRLVREIAQQYSTSSGEPYRFSSGAMKNMQEAAEPAVVSLLEQAQEITLVRKRVTVSPKDMHTVMKLRHKDGKADPMLDHSGNLPASFGGNKI